MSKLYLYNYNNYFNRIVKRETSLANYGTPIYTLASTNFNYNDGVETYHDINYAGFDGNYLIVTDDNDNIVSRWFIIENKRLRGGQHRITLRRDLIVDNYDKVINAPCLINRAIIRDINNPLLLNKEGFNFNQIKKREILLNQREENYNYYYVLYFAKTPAGAGVSDEDSFPDISGTVNVGDLPFDIEVSTPISQSIYKQNTYKNSSKKGYTLKWRADTHWYSNKGDNYNYTTVTGNENINTSYPNNLGFFDEGPDFLWIVEPRETSYPAIINSLINTFSSFESALISETGYVEDPISQENLSKIIAANGKIIKDSNNNYYKLNVKVNTRTIRAESEETGAVSQFVKSRVIASGMEIFGDFGDRAVEYFYDDQEVIVTLAEQPNNFSISYKINFSDFYNTNAPYNIVYIPANEQKSPITEFDSDFGIEVTLDYYSHATINDRILNEIMLKAGKWLLDVQIIPYFPIYNKVDPLENSITILKDYYPNTLPSPVSKPHFYLSKTSTSVDEVCWWCFYVENPTFEFDKYNREIGDDELFILINGSYRPNFIDYKIENECNMYRITSPNYNGAFDFNLAKNGGLNSINFDITLRPYNPYIHINPKFSNLYGEDYNDSRGLICQGDFSLPIITDQFKNYEIQNKNYQQMFNRQIEHLDFEYGLQRTESIFGAIMGALGGALGGAVGGSVVGGPAGAGVGGLLGGVASAAGGAIDYNILKQRQAENKDLMIDNFKYQLGNVKALPTTINKVTPLTNNNKIFPIIEFYSCSEEEKNLLINYLSYKSMTINKIGSITEYLYEDKTFISGSLIRLEDLDMPTHEANEIYDEILKGVYI